MISDKGTTFNRALFPGVFFKWKKSAGGAVINALTVALSISRRLYTSGMNYMLECSHRGTGGRVAVLLLLSLSTFAQWPVVTQNARPWTRWWWMGSAVDEQNISSLLAKYKAAGLGGVEIVPIYGAMGYEKSYLSYLSPQWLKMLDYTVQQAAKNDMGVYMSVGTGWPIGGPQVTPANGASKLIVQTYNLAGGRPLTEKILVTDPKQKGIASLGTLMAYGSQGEVIDITDKVAADGRLGWAPAAGSWQLFAAFNGKTRQQVKRAAPGGEGPVLDHFSRAAVQDYFKAFDVAYGKTSHGVKVMYNDSYEVFDADWTPSFFNEFEQRRGYDLRRYLKQFTSKEDNDSVARLKADYRETMSDLMLHNFSSQFTRWSHDKKMLSLNQAHGSPGNLLDLYAAVDIPECETFGSSYFPIPGLRRDSADIRNVDPDPNMLKFASSAAHVTGHPLVTCETLTWLGEHFKTAPSQCKPEIEQVLLSGVNHMFYHGTTYSLAEAGWPGWVFYASLNWVPNNSLWPQLKGLNDYITRCQSILQQGQPDNEILTYWPVYDAWQQSKGMDMPLKVHNIESWLHPTPFYKNVVALQARGYSLDFASDSMLNKAIFSNGQLKVAKEGAAYKTLLVPQCRVMPVGTLQSILRLADAGATIVLQGLPEDVPGLNQAAERRDALRSLLAPLANAKDTDGVKERKRGKGRLIISADVEKALAYIRLERETLADSGLKFIRRSVAGGKYYYLVNHTPKTIDADLPLQYKGSGVIIMDPQTGRSGAAPFIRNGNAVNVRLQLKSGEALIVKVTDATQKWAPWNYYQSSGDAVALNRGWNLSFKEGGPSLPAPRKLESLQPWSALTTDTATQNFSGTGIYTTTFDLGAKKADEYLLKLGKVYESARVIINGQEAGIVWNIPFELQVGKYLKAGTNTITVEVVNLMANRIRYMDRNGIKWKAYHEINFVNINYKPFDASVWKVQPSGLEGPVQIQPLEKVR